MNSQVADLVGDRDGGPATAPPPRSHPYPFPLPRITTAAKKPLTVEEADSFTSSKAGIHVFVMRRPLRHRFAVKRHVESVALGLGRGAQADELVDDEQQDEARDGVIGDG